ncbi:TonB-dependent siderophore receptor [Synechococcales cyanobacterium C]|uniref:TonB-dependent siderophore receptor n=1 Tax=Petrachloros mirabilis ULC683 TaxID=2781853 RepID=A0A8K2A8P7_9CYAN|nr:TonB-dependent receptor [Petrachloros mirabilis]NCJ08269.1 TonB-dependent siderophore receptor [Petrachloros mirabilis ULC683]
MNMQQWQRSAHKSINGGGSAWRLLLLSGLAIALVGQPVRAGEEGVLGIGSQVPGEEGVSGVRLQVPGEEGVSGVGYHVSGGEGVAQNLEPDTRYPVPGTHNPIPNIQTPSLTVSDWIAQIEASLTQITNVRVEATETGLQVILETAEGDLSAPTSETVGNALIADIPNAVLALPEGDAFEQFGPAEGIALVSVTNEPGYRVRVAITGSDAPPVAQVSSTAQGLVLGVTPGTEVIGTEEDALQVVVTGEQDEGYNPSRATTATRTDTPLRDIPQSIQVVPRQVIEDQQAQDIDEIVRNVSGVNLSNSAGAIAEIFNIRGFGGTVLRDGFRRGAPFELLDTTNIERVEVLKGPSSVLFGQLEPGGIINVITAEPLAEPSYSLEFQAGSYDFYRPSLDLSGPLSGDRSLRYRLSASYLNSGSFRDFTNIERYFVAPALAWDISDNTRILLDAEFLDDTRPRDRGLVAIGTEVADIPIGRRLGEPFDEDNVEQWRAGLRFEHDFNEDWSIRSAFQLTSRNTDSFTTETYSLDETTGEGSERFFRQQLGRLEESYALQTDLTGRFATWGIAHDFLFGVELSRITSRIPDFFLETAPINIFNPEYVGGARPRLTADESDLAFDSLDTTNNIGIYLQDLISFTDNLKLLVGGRFDFIDYESIDLLASETTRLYDNAFSPRVGLVYQPSEMVSLYASYTRSFAPNLFSRTVDGSRLDSERGTQYEIGVRSEFLDGRLSAGLAAYQITKSNVAVGDPDNPRFSIQTGEQRSRGIELDVAGEIINGWNIIGSYAYTDAIISRDTSPLEGNQLRGVPRHGASLWTTYEIQEGDLQGLGFGIGAFFSDSRQGDARNTFRLPSFVRTDVALYYRRPSFQVALNIKNLFDVRYFEASNSRVAIDPGLPLTVVGTLSINF